MADSVNSRVLFYPSGSTTATRVYGQLGSFTTNSPNNGGVSANSLWPVWSHRRQYRQPLYCRQPKPSGAFLSLQGGTTATQVYGQLGSFTTNTANRWRVSANSLVLSVCSIPGQ